MMSVVQSNTPEAALHQEFWLKKVTKPTGAGFYNSKEEAEGFHKSYSVRTVDTYVMR